MKLRVLTAFLGSAACLTACSSPDTANDAPILEPVTNTTSAQAPPSCEGLLVNCGAAGDDNCCASPTVDGGTFRRGDHIQSTATVASFTLDKYEVTVGRFRRFVNAYLGSPANGAGEHPQIPNSGWQTGSWDSSLAADSATLALDVACSAGFQTWNTSGMNDTLPMNCVTWYEAFAFCAWDGARLPTEAEWEYAATGGAEQRKYPWGDTRPNNTDAAYDCLGNGTAGCVFSDILAVGSDPAGAGKYGQMDLAGSMWEWALDLYAPYPVDCDNCANLNSGSLHVMRSGNWRYSAMYLPVASRAPGPTFHGDGYGFRCARAL